MTLKLCESVELTTDHPASSYGIPVYHQIPTGRGLGPSQQVYPAKFEPLFGANNTAAAKVIQYAQWLDLSEDDLAFVRLFLGQWPEGPQI